MLARMLGPAGAANLHDYHIIGNPRIDLNGDRATATSRYVMVMRGADGSPVPALAGVYHDDLVRLHGKWLIKRRVAEDIMPSPEEWHRIMEARRAKP